MSMNCPPAPENKKAYISEIGTILVKEHGKKKYYTPEEVKKASKKSTHYNTSGLDWSCWAMCTFSSHSDFDAYHQTTGEACDYVVMKTEMLSGIATTSTIGMDTVDWFSIPDLDIDASWLDFGETFGGLFEGVGGFIAGIFDGIS